MILAEGRTLEDKMISDEERYGESRQCLKYESKQTEQVYKNSREKKEKPCGQPNARNFSLLFGKVSKKKCCFFLN
jgi:hypothetical protein